MKTWSEFTQEFMSSLISKSDDELVDFLSQQFRYIFEGQEDEPMTIDDLVDATFIDEPDGCKRGYGFQILALLAATKKEKTFSLVRDHLIKGNAINGFNGSIRFLMGDDFSFDSKEEEMAIRNNPKLVIISTKDKFGGPDLEDLFSFRSCSVSASDFDEDTSINISEIEYEYLTERIKLQNDVIDFTLSREVWKNFPSQTIIDHSDDITKDEFGSLPTNSGDILISIKLEPINIGDLIPRSVINQSDDEFADLIRDLKHQS